MLHNKLVGGFFMPKIHYTEFFQNKFNKTLKKYKKSQNRIQEEINSTDSTDGDVIPGLRLGDELRLRKVRIRLPEYKTGKSRSLRFIFLFIQPKDTIVPVTIYKKGTYANEQKAIKEIKKSLKEALKEIGFQ